MDRSGQDRTGPNSQVSNLTQKASPSQRTQDCPEKRSPLGEAGGSCLGRLEVESAASQGMGAPRF